MSIIIDGKKISQDIKDNLKKKILSIEEGKRKPGLAVLIVGDDPASKIYVKAKKKSCEYIGINSFEFNLSKEISEEKILEIIDKLNLDEKIDGILVQLPLPKHINQEIVINRISSYKDVDCFTKINIGNLFYGFDGLKPCTPNGCIRLLKEYNIEISGKFCVIVGRSNIVGKPLAIMLTENDATVCLVHSKTLNLKMICKTADILISAVGKKNMITDDMVKQGSVIIDVGINRDQDGNITGDVDYKNVEKIAGYITPVPGSVGPMTIAMLMENTVYAYLNKK